MSPSAQRNAAVATGVWLVAFIVGPLLQLKFLALMPGDLGDPRLNNYFLENIYQFIIGRSESLWHLGFFYPHPWILGLSDNLFGASPIYLVSRLAQIPSDTSFQIWFLASYLVNYAAAYIALRRLKLSASASIVGAIIFTFALPVPSQFEHAQLAYRFGAALAIGEVGRFAAGGGWRRLYAAGGWLVWQFYCSIYIGFFALVFIGAAVGLWCVARVIKRFRWSESVVPRDTPPHLSPTQNLGAWWKRQSLRDRLWLVGAPFLGAGALLALLYPYMRASQVFSASRTFADIEGDMPRLWSYLVSDHSILWAHNARILGVGHFEEHQLFVGALALLLLGVGVWVVLRDRTHKVGRLYAAALAVTFFMSLDVGGHSLWQPLVHLPLFSAIRVVSRFDLVWLFPIGYLAALGVEQVLRLVVARLSADDVTSRTAVVSYLTVALVVSLLIAEYSLVVPSTTEKVSWRARVEAADALVPANLPSGSILAFAAPDAPWHPAMEIDAMWVALNRGAYTMNGYAGFGLPGYNYPPGSDRSQVIERLGWYLVYAGQAGNTALYQELAGRVVLAGFDASDTADTSWLTAPRTLTLSDRPYTDGELAGISVSVVGSDPSRGIGVVDIDISNQGPTTICADSYLSQPVDILWRFAGSNGSVSPWRRRSLPCDLAPGETVRMRVLIDEVVDSGAGVIEFGIEQVGVHPPALFGDPSAQVAWVDR